MNIYIYTIMKDNLLEVYSKVEENKFKIIITGFVLVLLVVGSVLFLSGSDADTETRSGQVLLNETPVENVEVKVIKQNGAVVETTTTNSNGEYRFSNDTLNQALEGKIVVNGVGVNVPDYSNDVYMSAEKDVPENVLNPDFVLTDEFTDTINNEEVVISQSLDSNSDSAGYVSNAYTLQAVDNQRYNQYTQTNHMNVSVTQDWNEGAGFEPIGVYNYQEADPFTSKYNGGNYVIEGLHINRPDEVSVGLFAGTVITNENQDYNITNTRIQQSEITGGDNTGAIVGYNDGGVVTQSTVAQTTVNSSDSKNIGGVVGHNDSEGVINKVETIRIDVIAPSSNAVGGVVGYNESEVSNVVTRIPSVEGSAFVGGLVGLNSNTITASYTDSPQIIADASGGTLIGSVGGAITQRDLLSFDGTVRRNNSSVYRNAIIGSYKTDRNDRNVGKDINYVHQDLEQSNTITNNDSEYNNIRPVGERQVRSSRINTLIPSFDSSSWDTSTDGELPRLQWNRKYKIATYNTTEN